MIINFTQNRPKKSCDYVLFTIPNYLYLVIFCMTNFIILFVHCGYFCGPASPMNYYHCNKKHRTSITCLPGHRERIMEDVREPKAASCICGYGEDHPSTSDTSRATFLHSIELRNEAAQISQDRTAPSFTVLAIYVISN